MTTAYCLSYEYLNYSHREEIDTSTDKVAILEHYHQFVKDEIEDDSKIDIDYISVEEVIVELNEDGSIDDIIDYGDVIAETTFVEPGE
jgi:hypothetical protein